MVGARSRDLELDEADVVLGGGMLRAATGFLHERVVARLPRGATPGRARATAGAGAALAALDAGRRGGRREARACREELRGPLRCARSPTRTSSARRSRARSSPLRGARPFLLGCPGGRSLRTTYRALGGAERASRGSSS